MFLIWLIWFCPIDLWMLTPVYIVHQQRELSWSPSWAELGLSLLPITMLPGAEGFWKHSTEETGHPALVFCASRARPVRLCVTLPGSEHVPPGQRAAGGQLAPRLRRGLGTGSPRSLPGSHFQAEPPSWCPHGLRCRSITPLAPSLSPRRCSGPA